VQQIEAFVNQRRRWLSAQFIYFRKNIYKGFVQLLKHGNVDYFDKLIQFMVPPRIIALGATYSISLLYLILVLVLDIINPGIFFYSWGSLAIITSLAIILSIPIKKFGFSTLKSLWALPGGFLLTLVALLKTGGANKKFIHTPHGINKN